MYEVNCGEYASRRWALDSHNCWYSYCVGGNGYAVSGADSADGSSGAASSSAASGVAPGVIVGIVVGVVALAGVVIFAAVRKYKQHQVAKGAEGLTWDQSI